MKPKNNKKHISFALLLTSICAFMLAVPAFAFAEEEKSGVEVLLPDMNEFIPMLIAFALIDFILWKFGGKVLDNIIVKREDKSKKDVEDAENKSIESKRTLDEYKKQLDNAKAEADDIVMQAKLSAQRLTEDMKKQAEAQAEQIVSKARASIEAEKQAAISELQASVANFSVDVASKILDEDFSDDDHRKLIERCVEKAGKIDA
ncbi:MAG: F0F1 ATP synthase subunit B [Coriobacteriales bacterium]|nr:F0F1 ATP synthase subunit B [Coriobacteriales bacterium]